MNVELCKHCGSELIPPNRLWCPKCDCEGNKTMNANDPAFPAYTIIESKDEIGRNRTAIVNNGGMSLRIYTAIKAMQGYRNHSGSTMDRHVMVSASVKDADALIAELNKEQT